MKKFFQSKGFIVSSLANELVEPFNELSKKTRLTKTKLLDEAIEDLLKKYAAKDL